MKLEKWCCNDAILLWEEETKENFCVHPGQFGSKNVSSSSGSNSRQWELTQKPIGYRGCHSQQRGIACTHAQPQTTLTRGRAQAWGMNHHRYSSRRQASQALDERTYAHTHPPVTMWLEKMHKMLHASLPHPQTRTHKYINPTTQPVVSQRR